MLARAHRHFRSSRLPGSCRANQLRFYGLAAPHAKFRMTTILDAGSVRLGTRAMLRFQDFAAHESVASRISTSALWPFGNKAMAPVFPNSGKDWVNKVLRGATARAVMMS